jgi:Spy/CpxP family protein refolding chaperone
MGLFALALAAGWLMAAPDQKSADPTPTARGSLPANWKKLGLSDEQNAKIKKISADYRTKIDALEEQIKQLRQQEFAEEVKVLTDAQKARLKEIVEEKVTPADPSKPPEPPKPPDATKKDDTKKDDTKKDDTKKDDTKKDDTKK